MIALLASVNPTTFAAKWNTALSSHIRTATVLYPGGPKVGLEHADRLDRRNGGQSSFLRRYASFGGQQVNIVAGEMKNVKRSIPIGLDRLPVRRRRAPGSSSRISR